MLPLLRSALAATGLALLACLSACGETGTDSDAVGAGEAGETAPARS